MGWRGWFLAPFADELLLCSPIYRTVWLPRRETVARCCRGADRWALLLHEAPDEGCRCGIYASQAVAQAASLLARQRARRCHAVQGVLGRVFLWGKVVECERGWRAERAYPASLYVPALAPAASARRRFLRQRRAAPLDEIVHALSHYGVPVEPVACATLAELTKALAQEAEAA